MSHTNKTKGVSLLFVVLITSVILAASLGISGIFIQQTKMMGEIGYSVASFYAADSGVEHELYELYKAPQGELRSGFYNIEVSENAFYDVEAKCGAEVATGDCPTNFEIDSNCNASNYCIKSVGSYKKVKRAIEITY